MKKNFFFALSTLIGLTIGAGIFGVPYVIFRSGIISGLFYFFILGGAVLLMHLFYGEITLRTKDRCRLVGLAQRYLGEKAKILIAITTILGGIGVLLAYLILGGDFLRIIFSSFVNLSSTYFSLIFWFFLTIFILLGLKFIAPIEVFSNFLFISIFFVICLLSFFKFKFSNLPLFSLKDIFLPYGVILFSLVAWEAIPEASDVLKNNEKKSLKAVIISNTIIVSLVYLLFTLSVIGVAGKNTSLNALSGLIPFLGKQIVVLGASAALITIADSFLILAISLRNTFRYDFKISKLPASILSSVPPLILFLLGFRSFINVISFVGVFIGLINGLAIMLIYKKAKVAGDRKPEYSLNVPNILLYLLMSILILGTILQIFYEIHR